MSHTTFYAVSFYIHGGKGAYQGKMKAENREITAHYNEEKTHARTRGQHHRKKRRKRNWRKRQHRQKMAAYRKRTYQWYDGWPLNSPDPGLQRRVTVMVCSADYYLFVADRDVAHTCHHHRYAPARLQHITPHALLLRYLPPHMTRVGNRCWCPHCSTLYRHTPPFPVTWRGVLFLLPIIPSRRYTSIVVLFIIYLVTVAWWWHLHGVTFVERERWHTWQIMIPPCWRRSIHNEGQREAERQVTIRKVYSSVMTAMMWRYVALTYVK